AADRAVDVGARVGAGQEPPDGHLALGPAGPVGDQPGAFLGPVLAALLHLPLERDPGLPASLRVGRADLDEEVIAGGDAVDADLHDITVGEALGGRDRDVGDLDRLAAAGHL